MQQKEKKKSPLLISEKKSNIYKNLNKNKYMPLPLFTSNKYKYIRKDSYLMKCHLTKY